MSTTTATIAQTATIAPEDTAAGTGGDDEFDLDISIVESSPVVPDLLRSTSDNCGGTCVSACTSCRS